MKVFKFGGASVKDADGVRNVARVLAQFPEDDLVIVVSAMGKTTNALEELLTAWRRGGRVEERIAALESAHVEVLREVADQDAAAADDLRMRFAQLRERCQKRPGNKPDLDYDQIVGLGEYWSTLIVNAHLNSVGVRSSLFDAGQAIRTDDHFRAARVDWEVSRRQADRHLRPLLREHPYRVVTQGFVARTAEGLTTTLGREGSDFSAAIFAYLLDAESVTIWKDVPGMFNADPKRFPETRLLEHISYREAIELSYFGASVIHPRTLQPLQRKDIPLFIRSFSELDAPGSTISEATAHDTLVPSFIVKPDQFLISITPRDLSFVVEENLSGIFWLFAHHGVRIDLMQNSAVAFSVVVDGSPRARELITELRKVYEVRYNEGCELVTVRHFDEATLDRLTTGREVLIEQRSRVTARFVLKGAPR
ncbi:MAG: aspartate kinase [Flavobacteriales bacterium]|nr:aspartate kinase [Flavobacteriales bacterium]MCB9192988.1 aspartate kinase [Flavobacteriales bacterium]